MGESASITVENVYRRQVVRAGVVLMFFAVPHLIDDFLFDIPAEFGLTNMPSQILGGIFIVGFVWILLKASHGSPTAYLASACLGGFLALAGILKHIPRMLPPGPYWSGFFSEFLIVGLILSGIVLAGISFLAWWESK